MSEAPLSTDQITPGPWETTSRPYIEAKTGEGAIFSQGDWNIYPPLGSAGPVAVVGGVADARLIAAAPDLLAALKAIVESAASVPSPYHGHAMDPINDLRLVSGRRVQAAREVLAKVEGKL